MKKREPKYLSKARFHLFVKATEDAHWQGFCTVDEGVAAIEKYRAELHAHGIDVNKRVNRKVKRVKVKGKTVKVPMNGIFVDWSDLVTELEKMNMVSPRRR